MSEFLTNNELYVVMIIVLVVWLGIYAYLLKIDKKVTQIEQEFKKKG